MMILRLRWDMIKPKNNSLLLLREGEHEVLGQEIHSPDNSRHETLINDNSLLDRRSRSSKLETGLEWKAALSFIRCWARVCFLRAEDLSGYIRLMG